MEKNCQSTIVPVVDNTSTTCSECGFTDFECIIANYTIPYLSVLSGDTLKRVVFLIEQDLKTKGARISTLESNYKPTTVTTDDYTITATDTTVYFSPTSLTGTATLPTITASNRGKKITFVNYSGDTKTLSVYRTGSATTNTTILNDTVMTLQAIGAEWIKIS